MSHSSDRRRANQEFKRRYAAMTPEEREKLNRSSNRLGCVIGGIVAAIVIIIFYSPAK